MITNTLIQGLTDRMVQARVNSFDARGFYYGTLFPVKKVSGFMWKMLQNQLEAKNVAADIHTDNGTILRKRRPVFETAMGDIPFISISRDMKRSEIKEYQTALAFAPDSDATALVEYWGNDVDFCFNGVNAELEYIALALASNGGKLDFTTTNNATFANEFALDYDVDEEQKQKTSVDWADADADILGDLRKIIKDAKAKNRNPRFCYLNLDEWYKVATNKQIIAASASFANNALNISQTPDLATVNSMLSRQAWMNGLQLKVIDQTVTREFADGSQTSGNPFADNRLVLSETERLGSTQYDVLNESNELILRAQRTHIIVKKYGEVEPTKEVTIGQTDAMPVFDSAYKNIYVRTDAKDWD